MVSEPLAALQITSAAVSVHDHCVSAMGLIMVMLGDEGVRIRETPMREGESRGSALTRLTDRGDLGSSRVRLYYPLG